MPVAAPPIGRLATAAILVGGVPALGLGLLMATGELAAEPGALALAATIGMALLVARVWLGNLSRLRDALRRAEDGDGELPEIGGPFLLPSIEEIAESVRRLARLERERSALVGRLRRADEAIVETLPDPLVVLDEGATPLRANAAARALFSTAGSGGGDLAALLRHPALSEAVAAARAEGRPQVADIALPVPVPRELRVHAIPMEPALSDGGRLVLLLSDRTRDRAVERMRADFVANASHELRTPLASLIGFIETLRGPAEDDKEARARFLGIMAEQSERMRRLIDDLLGLSRIEITEHQAPTGRVDLAALAQAEADALEPVFAARKVRLEVSFAPCPMAAPADAEQLAQVLRNLLENAVRHGREGGQVRLAVAPASEVPGGPPRWPTGPGVVLSVADDGPGIPKEHIPRLTERFYRVDRGRGRATGGTGLGLAIVKHVVNRHRGRLVIESEEGVGATFRVWLPAAPVPVRVALVESARS
jgi:two-component system phosphate regulon sensor histidine kinase PhoR